MKILLDESVPVQLRKALRGHEVRTVSSLGWKGLENGELLQAAEDAGFDAIVLADKNLRYQQNLASRRLTIFELWTNHRPTLDGYLGLIAQAVSDAQPGAYVVVEPNED